MMPQIAVFASGMVTPLGYNAASSLAALRAGVSAVRQTPCVDPESGEPLSGARVSLPHWWYGIGMLADIVAPALDECFLAAQDMAPAADIPILLGVSAPDRPGRPSGLDDHLLDEIHARLELRQHRLSRLLSFGQCGCAKALVLAREILARQ